MTELVTARNEPPTGYVVWEHRGGGPWRWRWARTEWADGDSWSHHGGRNSRDAAVRAAWRDSEG